MPKTLVELFTGDKIENPMGAEDPERLLRVAETVGGTRMRHLATYLLYGTLPEGDTVQTVCHDLSEEERMRPMVASLIMAASERALDAWSIRYGYGVRYLTMLRDKDKAKFVETVEMAVEKGGNASAGARLLGIGVRTMFRYLEEIGESGDKEH